MRFSVDIGPTDAICATFMDALAQSVYYGLRHIQLPRSQKEQWCKPLLGEIHDILSGLTSVAGRTGAIQALLMLATDSAARDRILGGEDGIQLVINESRFDYAQMDLLCQLVDIVDRGVADLEMPQTKIIEIVTEITFGICCDIDGSTIISTPRGRILPILAFAEDVGGTQALTSSGGQSWMHEYVHGVVEEYFAERPS